MTGIVSPRPEIVLVVAVAENGVIGSAIESRGG